MCSSALSEKDLHCLKTNLLVVSGRRNPTHCLLLFHLALSFMAHNKPLTYMLMTTSNTGFNWFAPWPWGIPYMRKVSNGYSYTSNHHVMFKITKTPGQQKHDDARPDKIRQCKAAPRQVGVLWFRKLLYLRALWCMQYRDILCAIAV